MTVRRSTMINDGSFTPIDLEAFHVKHSTMRSRRAALDQSTFRTADREAENLLI